MFTEVVLGLKIFGCGFLFSILMMVLIYVVAIKVFTRKLQKFAASEKIKLPPAQIFVASKDRSPFAPPLNDYELALYNNRRFIELLQEKETRRLQQDSIYSSGGTASSISEGGGGGSSSPSPHNIETSDDTFYTTSSSENGKGGGSSLSPSSPTKKRAPMGASKSSKSGKIGLPRYRLLVHVIRANNLIPTEKNG